MNEYLKGHIDACDKLFKNPEKFRAAVLVTTGLTVPGFKEDSYCQKLYREKMNAVKLVRKY